MDGWRKWGIGGVNLALCDLCTGIVLVRTGWAKVQ